MPVLLAVERYGVSIATLHQQNLEFALSRQPFTEASEVLLRSIGFRCIEAFTQLDHHVMGSLHVNERQSTL